MVEKPKQRSLQQNTNCKFNNAGLFLKLFLKLYSKQRTGNKKYYEGNKAENLKNGKVRFRLTIDFRKKEETWLNEVSIAYKWSNCWNIAGTMKWILTVHKPLNHENIEIYLFRDLTPLPYITEEWGTGELGLLIRRNMYRALQPSRVAWKRDRSKRFP